MPTLDVGQYDPVTDTIVIEGTRYAGALFREGLGIKAMVGQVFRVVKHAGDVITITRLTGEPNV